MSAAHEYLAWVAKAEQDLRAIEGMCKGLPVSDVPWSVVCFHAQQAAEKYLKGYLIAKTGTVSQIHDTIVLLESCERLDATLNALRADCQRLSFYAIQPRYPSRKADADEQEGTAAAASAQHVRQAIRERLHLD